MSAQSILKKSYTVKTKNKGAFIFSAVSIIFASLFFVIMSGFELHFTWDILPYSLGFALAYGTAVLMSFVAIRLGSLSLTSLITSYSLIIPTFYGLIFLGEDVGVLFYIGLSILCISLFLMNSKHSGCKISFAWVVAVFLAFLGNGVCSTVQLVQQREFAGQYKSETMIIALLTVGAVMVLFSFLFEKDSAMFSLKNGGLRAAACGIMNGVCNLLVMILAVSMDASIMYPILSAGGIILTGSLSLLIYKEKLSIRQCLALCLGIASVVLMNI